MATIYVSKNGNDSTGNGSSGNPYATPGKAVAVGLTAGDRVIIRVDGGQTYTFSTTSTNVTGGPLSLSGESEDSAPIEFVGVGAGDDENINVLDGPIFDCAAYTSFTAFASSAYSGAFLFKNINVDGQGGSGNVGFNLASSSCGTENCRTVDCPTGFSSGTHYRSRAEGGATGFYLPASLVGCRANGCTTAGVTFGGCTLDACIVTGCAIGFNGSASADASTCHIASCFAYNSTSHGFYFNNYYRFATIDACGAYLNGGYGYTMSALGNGGVRFRNCAAGSNTSGPFNSSIGSTPWANGPHIENYIPLTADPFVDAPGGDFNINDISGGGALLRAVTYDLPG